MVVKHSIESLQGDKIGPTKLGTDFCGCVLLFGAWYDVLV